jgi:hypothetical protein
MIIIVAVFVLLPWCELVTYRLMAQVNYVDLIASCDHGLLFHHSMPQRPLPSALRSFGCTLHVDIHAAFM